MPILSGHTPPVAPQSQGRMPQREPIFLLPPALIGVIALCSVLFLYQSTVRHFDASALMELFGFTPARFVNGLSPSLFETLCALLLSKEQAYQTLLYTRHILVSPFVLATPLSYAFLHASASHLCFNMAWLAAFGTPIARRLTVLRFLLFFCAGALAGSLFHTVCFPLGLSPLVGASAAVCAMMGAVARFFGYQEATPLGLAKGSLPTIGESWAKPIVRQFVAFWFITNVIFGVTGGIVTDGTMQIAWQAHIGGFLFGFLGFSWFDRKAAVTNENNPPHP